jgi:hypothetical protein
MLGACKCSKDLSAFMESIFGEHKKVSPLPV